jgi:hypothetical protein
MSENLAPQDVMDRLARLDSKLEQLLAHHTHPEDGGLSANLDLPEDAGFEQIGFAAPQERTIQPAAPSMAPPKKIQSSRVTLSAMEVDSIFQKVEKINRDEELMERVEKLERQNRRIVTLGAMLMTLVLLVVGVSAFLLLQTDFFHKGGSRQARQGVDPPKFSASEATAEGHASQTPGAAAAVLDPPKAAPAVKVADQPLVTSPADPKPDAVEAPEKYVGSKTSNKYHLPGCKWVREIKPHNRLNFSSTEEARKQGYIPCPTCGAPHDD